MNPSIFKKLKSLPQKNTIQNLDCIELPNFLSYNITHTFLTPEHINVFQEISDDMNCIEKYNKILNGEIMNPSENKKVLHHQTRQANKNQYTNEQKRATLFAKQIHNKTFKGYSNKPFKNIVQIGIGGSHLGPEALSFACHAFMTKEKKTLLLTPTFIANIDPLELLTKLSGLNLEETLFIIVSKSGSTEETHSNMTCLENYWQELGHDITQLKKHCFAITMKKSLLDTNKFIKKFYIDKFIGGRFSIFSVVGSFICTCCYGEDCMKGLHNGALKIDENSKQIKIQNNLALFAAFTSIYYRNYLNYTAKAIIPYSFALTKLPAHIQQVACESNGKQVNIHNEKINYKTSPVIFGEPGTNAQHSFFQMIHQGSDIIPVEFIGFSETINHNEATKLASKKLFTNLIAQISALTYGEKNDNHNKNFPGKRPSTLLLGKTLNPETIGAIFAFYENKTMFEGFLWNLNSFDQEGVQLGKKLAKKFFRKNSKTKT